jgi:hypothetical protein
LRISQSATVPGRNLQDLRFSSGLSHGTNLQRDNTFLRELDGGESFLRDFDTFLNDLTGGDESFLPNLIYHFSFWKNYDRRCPTDIGVHHKRAFN